MDGLVAAGKVSFGRLWQAGHGAAGQAVAGVSRCGEFRLAGKAGRAR